MKRVFLLLLAYMLMLTAISISLADPIAKESQEPKKETYSVRSFTEKDLVSMETNYLVNMRKTMEVRKAAVVKNSIAKAKEPVKVKLISQKSKSKQEGKKGYFTLTAFTAGYESTGKSKGHPEYGKTASGAIVKEGRTAACPASMDFGTKLHIPSLDNTYICQDRGAAIKEGKIDIYIEDLDEAREFGKKLNVEVFVIKD